MHETVAKALAALVGPLMAEGMSLSIAERVAKLRAFDAGTYPGESCERCGAVEALLDDWRIGAFPYRLCHRCSSRQKLAEDAAKRAGRAASSTVETGKLAL